MKVPYKKLSPTGHEKPLLPITLRNAKSGASRRFFALVDSGSDCCFFDAEFGHAIGLKVRTGEHGKVYGVVPGKWEVQYRHQIVIEVIGKKYTIEAGFMYGLSRNGYGIPGQAGFFDQVQAVTFERKRGVFEIIV
jgi:hypothetical protein